MWAGDGRIVIDTHDLASGYLLGERRRRRETIAPRVAIRPIAVVIGGDCDYDCCGGSG
jgi:hypothetical protein